ncbi:LysR family transcriptional regulator [Ectopseudomonas mendocina]|uniref:LysR family transcriptional regulator n=1 Tax=Ectopseudomonas mendocina TaxID=300 RepID=A0ABZ2RIM3_ECTME
MDRLAAMKTFVCVVEAGSFTRAADVLMLPKARVSQRISDLEGHLGVRLLNRTTRALSLTDDGHAYFAKCQIILQEIEELEGALKGGTQEPRGRLRVEALVSVARWIIAPNLQQFQARYPHISVRLSSSDRISNILEEGIDCTIRGGTLEDSSLIARQIGEVSMGLYASEDYLQRMGTPTYPQQLVEHQRIYWFSGQRNPFAWRLMKGSDLYDVPAQEGLQFDDPDVALASCMAGGGICPGAPFAVASRVRAGQLVPVLHQWHFKSRPVHILYPSNKHLSARVRCFVDWLVELIHSEKSLALSPEQLAQSVNNN